MVAPLVDRRDFSNQRAAGECPAGRNLPNEIDGQSAFA
jgi:hypothetical protein